MLLGCMSLQPVRRSTCHTPMPATTSCCVLMSVFRNPSTVPHHAFQLRKLQLHHMPGRAAALLSFLAASRAGLEAGLSAP